MAEPRRGGDFEQLLKEKGQGVQDFLSWVQTEKQMILNAVLEHLWLSLLSLLAAVLLAVPLAVLLSRRRRWAEAVLQFTGVLQTIPSLALLGLLIPLVGIGSPPVLIALTLYALLPVFQNTYLGLNQIDPAIKEAATAFGLSRWQSLLRIELPMALPAMISGIRTAAVLIVGTATLAALIGAGGLGQLILLGIDRHNMMLTVSGAVLSAALAVGVSALVGALQRVRRPGRLLSLVVAVLLVLGAAALWPASGGERRQIVVAGKLGSEPDILINMYRLLIEQEQPELEVVLKPNFGKTSFLFAALNSGEIDVYPEFTGTVLESLVTLPPGMSSQGLSPEQTYAEARRLLAEQYALSLLRPMAYQNTYALAVRENDARQYGLQRISDLKTVAGHFRAGFTLEFTDRNDGYRGLQRHGIRFAQLSSMEPALRYTALHNGKIDLIEAYSTDSELKQYRLVTLADDLGLFPSYQGAPLMKAAFEREHPQVAAALNRLAGRISAEEMSEMNYRVKAQGEPPEQVARDYLRRQGLLRE